jgi:putative ABC transport system substrate-binding protein
MVKTIIGLLVVTAVLAAVHLAAAQKAPPVRRIGILGRAPAPRLRGLPPTRYSPMPFYETIRQALRELGYVEGQHIVIELRDAESDAQLAELFTELVGLHVDVIVALGGAPRVLAKMDTGTVPIVFSVSGDPVVGGLVKSLARPGGTMTGISQLNFELVGKRLELLKEAVPRVSHVAVLADPGHPGEQRELRETQSATQRLGMTLSYHPVSTTADLDTAFEAISKEHAEALVVFPGGITMSQRQQIAEFAAQHQLPSVFGWKEYVEAGGLMAYGPNSVETNRRITVYVDKILKGAKPADLPVEQPMKFELVLNLKTAQTLGITFPPTLLVLADEVIK